jgi:hypothetical protein
VVTVSTLSSTNVMMVMSTICYLVMMVVLGMGAASIMVTNASSQLYGRGINAMKFVEMDFIMEMDTGTILMLMNVMTVTNDLETDVTPFVELKEAGAVVEVTLLSQMYALQYVVTGEYSTMNIVMMAILLVEMDAMLLALLSQVCNVQKDTIMEETTAQRYVVMVVIKVITSVMMET